MMITSLLAAALHKRLRRTGTYTTSHSIAAWQHRRLAVSWYASGMHRHLCCTLDDVMRVHEQHHQQAPAAAPAATAAVLPVVDALVAHVLAQHTAVCCESCNGDAHVIINLEHLALVG